jgi:divalent metal cation (Fe/Co/Zn/Cd) transporter
LLQHTRYPESKDRLEPIGVILFATVMGMSSLQIVVESAKVALGDRPHVTVDAFTAVCLGATIVAKALLYRYCERVAKRYKSGAVAAYAEDHFNDVVTNAVSVVAVVVAVQVPSLWQVDAVAAIVLAAWIIKSWADTGAEQISFLTGATAPPHFLNLCTFIAFNHSEHVMKVDTVRAYHFGSKFLVELDIVLPEGMPLKLTHDIGEALQMKLEALDDVQRAFVHMDYEWEHAPEHRNLTQNVSKRD